MFPYIAENGTLYFASNGHMGLGGLDIFSTQLEKGNWSVPRNLGAPINSNLDDFGYVLRKDRIHGYFCSNRAGGVGDDDIYSFQRLANGITYNGYTGDSIGGVTVEVKSNQETTKVITERDGSFSFNPQPNIEYNFTATKDGYHESKLHLPSTDSTTTVRIPMYPEGDLKLEVVVIDKKTHQPIDSALVKIVNEQKGMPEEKYTDKEGKTTFGLDTNSKYRIEGYKETNNPSEKYLRVSADISTKGVYPPTVMKETIELDKAKKVVPIKLEIIYYNLDKWDIRPDAAIELNKLVKLLKDNPTMEIELSSHTDCRGSKDYNMSLSKLRAISALEYIATQGISRVRMTYAGYGESRLLNNCQCEDNNEIPCTEEQHQINRRTEFKIQKF